MAESNDQSDQINIEMEHANFFEKNIEMEHAKNSDKNTEMEQAKSQGEGLRYLDFFHVAAIQALVCLSRLYDFAKENSGLLKPGFQTVEVTVKAVVGPVYDKFHTAPFEILKFADRKMGDAVEELGRHVPSLVKKAPEVAQSLSDEVHRAGVVGTTTGLAKVAYAKAELTAETLYTKLEPVAEHYAVSSWKSLNKLPVFPQVAQVVVPTAAYWTEKYNKVVIHSAQKGYAFSAYLPVVPVERIAKVFGENGEEVQATAAAQ